MNTHNNSSDLFNETQSLQVIREMIQVSHKKIKHDGILFIVWGWLMTVHYTFLFVFRKVVMTYDFDKIIKITVNLLPLFGLIFSVYYILKQRKKVQTYIGISLRYVWISLIVCLSLTNMIIFNVIHEVNFELQHPIFMILIAFATVVTGGILRYRLIIFGGIAFGILAYISSYFSLEIQILLEAGAWLLAFIIPGHILYANRKSLP
ncbi:MAG: hypothetical protein JW798_14760 [Prolixibacteraceae bacterium]|nr:hypothetical protein [Prolixibacteraceae bacterium]